MLSLTPLTSRFFCTVLFRAGVKHPTGERWFFYLLLISQQNVLNKSCRKCFYRHLHFLCYFSRPKKCWPIVEKQFFKANGQSLLLLQYTDSNILRLVFSFFKNNLRKKHLFCQKVNFIFLNARFIIPKKANLYTGVIPE